jgi:hypothetical protein
VALLLSAAVVTVLASASWHIYERYLLMMWAYALWGLGNFALPRFNASWPRWAIAPDIWPWLGLLLVGRALVVWGLPWLAVPWAEAAPLSIYLAALALYLFLLLRNSAWGGWPWIAVGTLTCAGLVCNAAAPWALATVWVLRLPSDGMAIPWRAQNLTLPLLVWPSGVLGFWLLYLAVWDALGILASSGAPVSLLHSGPTVLLAGCSCWSRGPMWCGYTVPYGHCIAASQPSV